jgi:hypothetical protein
MQALMPYLTSPLLADSMFSSHPVASWIGVVVVALIILAGISFGPSFVRYMHIRHM